MNETSLKHDKRSISIITVVYNGIKDIERSILNSLAQTYKPLELIIIDGGSTDGTLDIIRKYEPQIKWISEKDHGIYDAMNKGALLATGEWLLFHNCGDYFLSPNSIADFMNHYVDRDEMFVLGNIISFNEFGYKQFRPNIIDTSFYAAMPVQHPSTLIRRTWQEMNLYDIKYKNSADYDFFIKSFKNGASFTFIDMPIVLFDCCDGATACHYDRTMVENFEILSKHGASVERLKEIKKSLRHFKIVSFVCKWIPFMERVRKNKIKRSYIEAGWTLSKPSNTLKKFSIL